jgi:acetyl-CoA acetyltransferase
MDQDIFVAGVGMTQFGCHSTRAVWQLADEALTLAMKDAGADPGQIEQVFYSGATQGALQGQTAVPGQVVLARLGIGSIPVFNVENACASGTSAFQLAVQGLRAGACDVALALGSEKMNIEDRVRAIGLFEGGWDVSRAEENASMLLALGEGVDPPPGKRVSQAI